MILNFIRRVLGRNSGLQRLADALRQPEVGVNLYAELRDGDLNTVGGETAVFTFDVYEKSTGDKYKTTELEFTMPQSGVDLDNPDSDLGRFLKARSVYNVDEIVGLVDQTFACVHDEDGNLRIDW